jgi:uncharacterized protein (TIGR02246 family)
MNQVEIELIIAETQAFAEAMNAGDAALAASFYTEDGVRVGGFGDAQRGRIEIEAAYNRLLHQTMPGARLNQERGSVRMLTPDLAVWQGVTSRELSSPSHDHSPPPSRLPGINSVYFPGFPPPTSRGLGLRGRC